MSIPLKSFSKRTCFLENSLIIFPMYRYKKLVHAPPIPTMIANCQLEAKAKAI